MNTLVFTCGDINGIGPEIVIKTINKIQNPSKRKIIFICPSNVFEHAASITNPEFEFKILQNFNEVIDSKKNIIILDIGKVKLNVGQPTKISGLTSAKAIEESYKLISNIKRSAVITAPISKTSFELASINYPGQTEFYASLTNTKKYLMMFLSNKMKAVLLTIHVPIKKVSSLISFEKIKDCVDVLEKSLIKDFNIKSPEIAILGLNPHNGENGRIGNEENKILIPTIKKLKKNNLFGPYVSDAFFGNKNYKDYDAIIGIYHDQILIPFKMLSFDYGVNYTAGLPIIRVSPDHGTAFDIADFGIAKPSSMISAVKWAEKIISNRSKNE
ncbi:MAG: 4-hydroxythreonine-4-phosphate dehydrogenase PdxA [Melioribacteraceae bacterium]|nr:4-hydroxythreonine-4-phosphate dehydrogenase PdxA [Melioribacteraceae bacterium]